MNKINVIFPYKENTTWMFDDEKRGLIKEPFVLGIPEMIDSMIFNLKLTNYNLKFIFSEKEFPNYHACLKKLKDDCNGAWYAIVNSNIGQLPINSGWLCPATLLYFSEMPNNIFVRIEEKI